MKNDYNWLRKNLWLVFASLFMVFSWQMGISQTTITYSEQFFNGQGSSGTQCSNWNNFRAQLTPQNYTKVTISGTFDNTGISCTDPVVVAQLAEALNTLGAGVFESCDGNTWSICTSRYQGEVWLNPPFLCSGANCPNPGYILRPCIGGSNSNWGGVSTQTCGAPDQIMTMEFEVDGGGGPPPPPPPGDPCTVNEDFESGPGGWTSGIISGSNNTWAVNSTAGNGANLNSNAFGCQNGSSIGFEHSFIQSPVITVNAGDEVTFDHWQCNESGFYDREYLEISYDGGATWTILIDYTDAIWFTQSTWETHSATIPQSSMNAIVRFRYNTWDGCCGCSGGWWLDNIEIGAPDCDGGGGGSCPLSADFESGAGGWSSTIISGSNNTWAVNSTAGNGVPLGSSAYGCQNGSSIGFEHSALVSPVFSVNAGDELIFDTWQCNESGFYDREYVEISYDGGATWNILIDYTDTRWFAQQSWQTITVTIPQSSANAQIRFRYNTIDSCCGCTGGWWLDNISVGPPGCGDSSCPSVVQITCPPDVEVECDESTDPADTGEPTGEPSCDGGTITYTYTDAQMAGTCPQEYTIERTWTADDGATTNSCVQIIDVVDTTPPEWDDSDAFNRIFAECNGRDDQADTIAANNVPIATDNCGLVTVTLVDQFISQNLCGGSAVYDFIFEAEDECGNATSYLLQVVIEDTSPPQLVDEAEDVTVECDGMGNLTELNAWLNSNGGADTYDRCSGTYWINDYDPANFIPGCGGTGSVTVTFTPFDDCDNEGRSTTATFTIVDTTPPEIITEASDVEVECGEDGEVENDQFLWLDNNGGAVAEEVCGDFEWSWEVIDEQSDCKGEVSLTVEFTATDECDNSSSTIATYTIVDTRPPAIILPFEEETISCDEDVDWGPVYAEDECTPELPTLQWTDEVEESGCDQTYTITRTWTATDPCGNVSTAVQVINVVDDEAPELTFNNTSIFFGLNDGDTYFHECGDPLIFDESDVDVADNCYGGFMQVSMSDETIYSASCIESGYVERQTWTFSAEDPCGNVGTLTVIIDIVDTTPPVITVPADMTIDCDEPVVFGPIDITDNCGSPLSPVTFEDDSTGGDCFGGDVVCFTRTYFVTDFCGNIGNVTQTICQEDMGTRPTDAPQDNPMLSDKTADLSVFPNPARSELNVLLQLGDNQEGDLMIMNAHGQLVRSLELEAVEGVNKEILDIIDLESGVYYIIWKSGETYMNKPFIKMNR